MCHSALAWPLIYVRLNPRGGGVWLSYELYFVHCFASVSIFFFSFFPQNHMVAVDERYITVGLSNPEKQKNNHLIRVSETICARIIEWEWSDIWAGRNRFTLSLPDPDKFYDTVYDYFTPEHSVEAKGFFAICAIPQWMKMCGFATCWSACSGLALIIAWQMTLKLVLLSGTSEFIKKLLVR